MKNVAAFFAFSMVKAAIASLSRRLSSQDTLTILNRMLPKKLL